MTLEELENWLTENKLNDMNLGSKHECYYKNNLFIVYRKNYFGKYELKTFSLKYLTYNNEAVTLLKQRTFQRGKW